MAFSVKFLNLWDLPLNIPTPTPAPCLGGPVACLGGPPEIAFRDCPRINYESPRKFIGKILERLGPFLGHSYGKFIEIIDLKAP